jgi:hypothetical protein
LSTIDDIVRLLKEGRPPDFVEKLAKEKKLQFPMDDRNRKLITDAGGSKSLLEALSVPGAAPPPPKGYDELMAEAEKLRKASDHRHSLDPAEEAKKLDRARPEAYAFIGYTYLYYLDSFPMARANFADAIDRGGQVEFRVYHGDSKSKITQQWKKCLGTLVVRKESIHYRADDGKHSFTLSDNQWSKVSKAGLLGSGITIVLTKGADKKEEEIHLFSARRKNEGEEEDLLIEMINK